MGTTEQAQDIKYLARQYYRCRGYFSDGTGQIGIRWRGWILWHRWDTTHGYVGTGSTRNPGAYANYHKFTELG